MKKTTSTVWIAVTAGCVSTAPAWAGKLELMPYAEYGATYNDNIFRVTDKTEAEQVTGQRQQSDVVQHGTIGVLVDWPMSRQRLTLAGQTSDYQYDRFERLDHSENEIQTALDYALGGSLSGTASYARTRRLDDFSDRDTTQPDFIERQNSELETFLEITPHWRIRTRLGYLKLDHSLASQRRFDRHENRELAAIQYQHDTGSLVGLGAERVEGEFPGRAGDDRLARSFTQRSAFMHLNWDYSPTSTVRARLGYTQRDNSGGDNRDFDGVTGRLQYTRVLSGKTRLLFGLSRQIYSVNNVEANYLRDTTARVQLRWTHSPKLNLVARVARRDQQYQALPGAEGASRSDTVNELTAELVYRPVRVLSFIFNTGFEHRESNRADETYDALTAGAAVRLSWDTD